MPTESLELTTVSINNKLFDVYYSVFDETEIKIESVEMLRDRTNIMEFLNDATMATLHKEVKLLHLEQLK
jgi:hypothetical protein